jgi:hypothetical protein
VHCEAAFEAQPVGEYLFARLAARVAGDALLERHCFNTKTNGDGGSRL